MYVQYNTKLRHRYECRTSLAGRDADPIVLKSLDDACEDWIVPLDDVANENMGETDDNIGPSSHTRLCKRRRQEESQLLSQINEKQPVEHSGSETEDDGDAQIGKEENLDDDTGSAREEDIDF